MPTCKLTIREADRAYCPPSKSQEFYRDRVLSGFVLVVSRGGRKRWAYQYRPEAKTSHRQITIGAYPPMHPEEARNHAIDLARKVAQGIDPQVERDSKLKATEATRQRRASLGFENQWPEFISYLTTKHPRGPRSSGYITNVRAFGNKYLGPVFQGTAIDRIDRAQVNAMLDEVDDDLPSVRKNLFVCLRTFLNWAETEEIIDRNPIGKMRPPPGVDARDRSLDGKEVAAYWIATESLAVPKRAFCQMLLLTGARRTNVASGFRWERLDRQKAVARIPRAETKNRKGDFAVFLSPPAVAILDELAGGPEWPDKGPVFTNDGKTAMNGFSKLKLELDSAFEDPIEHWRFHDLRRTFATHAQELGIPIHISELCLNHETGTFGGITGVYHRYRHEPERRKAYQLWAERVLQLVAEARS